jgi:hypothetical protein
MQGCRAVGRAAVGIRPALQLAGHGSRVIATRGIDELDRQRRRTDRKPCDHHEQSLSYAQATFTGLRQHD